ncbi:toll/interleukin-1 receptor domain-containing protein [Phosphitispora fastidiosa]|uniref:toll/interleukin-1 receptor domain-containing protein n=1 Tax=Phosphitispora fastidiosa TaxID=2837202 RepID=UPI001E5C349B|nr:toll/interleukin-1 receptor domain-containing protein [Phosphitispora fastidiosa]MBU7007153.1 hypothetical protein [Phosphitispora fastidiosa]
MAAEDIRPMVFISAKSEDFPYAEEIYKFLRGKGVPVFFSRESLPALGNSDYRKQIDKYLDMVQHMIVVASSVDNVLSQWVEGEWGFFINEKRSGRKAGNIVTVIVGSLNISDLPPSLRYYEVIPFEESDKVLKYVVQDASTHADMMPTKERATEEKPMPGTLQPLVPIKNFDLGYVYHENSDTSSMQVRYFNRGPRKAMELVLDFRPKTFYPVPPKFVGYAIRLDPPEDWRCFFDNGYNLSFEICADSAVKSINLEIKRLSDPRNVNSLEEIVKYSVELTAQWRWISLPLNDIAFPNTKWTHIREICLVITPNDLADYCGVIKVDNLILSKAPRN